MCGIKDMNNNDKINVIDEICSKLNRTEEETGFDSNKCLTYIDEFEQQLGANKRVTSLVSITALKDHYIDFIEKEWLINVRNKYDFKMGTAIHFTKIRRISQTVKYKDQENNEKESVGWNDDYILYRADSLINYDNKEFKAKVKAKDKREFQDEYKIWNLFRKVDDNQLGILDTEKLKSFYEDIFRVIKSARFDILCTSLLYDNSATHRKSKQFNGEQVKSPYTIAFGEHLDLLCFYLKQGFVNSDEQLAGRSTKLRWDGDDGFNPRSDYRLLFNKVIANGTTHYQSNTVRKCLDEIRFVNKTEIGYYDDLENQSIVSHIGCDMADFIAYFIGKFSIKDEIIKLEMSKGLSSECAEAKFMESVTFKIGDRVFSPYKEILKEKTLKNDSYTSVQVIKECHYYNQW